MAKDSRIEWTHHTFNPWWGCTKVSPGCKHCYAETWARRTGFSVWGPNAPRRQLSDAYWLQPLAWNKEAQRRKVRARVFCASMADVFEDRRDLDNKRARLWPLIEETPQLDWLLLTKRPQNMQRLAPWKDDWPTNVWAGTTVENQRWAEKRLEELLKVPAAVHFVSAEPLLGPLDLRQWIGRTGCNAKHRVDWVIAGGESGSYARPMNPDWVRALRDQCRSEGVAFLFKQWGNWRPTSSTKVNGFANKTIFLSNGNRITIANIGKKAAGRKLDGTTWNQVPNSAAA
jgi:protein gp37